MPTSRHAPVSSLFSSLCLRPVRRGLNVLALCALGFCVLPAFVGAQQTKDVPVTSDPSLLAIPYLHLKGEYSQLKAESPARLQLSNVPILHLKYELSPLKMEVPAQSLTVNIESKGATLGVLVDLLMDQAHVSYTLDASLAALPTGNVKLRKVPFNVALETILKMSHGKATYRLESGIYQIVEREATQAGGADVVPKTILPPRTENGSAPTVTPESGARAKSNDVGEKRINIDVSDADLSSVLNQIAKQAKIAITIDPSLLSHSQPVTAHLHNITLREALDMLLKTFTSSSTYQFYKGGLLIVPKAPSESPDMPAQTDPAAVSAQIVTLDAENTDLYSTLKLLFAQVKVNYTLDPALRTTLVTVHFRNLPFSTALERLLTGSGKPLTYRLKDGIYTIVPKM